MSKGFVLVAVICFLLAFVGGGFGINPHVVHSWNDLVALGLFFWAAASFV